jgi:hypothetical protein
MATHRTSQRLSLKDLIALLLAADGPTELEARSLGPLHDTIVFAIKPGRFPRLQPLLPTVHLTLRPDIGYAVEGLGSALHDLAGERAIRLVDDPVRGLLLRADALGVRARYRRVLFGMPPAVAQDFYRLGASLRARSATTSKMWERPTWSSARRSTSLPMKRRCGPLAVSR